MKTKSWDFSADNKYSTGTDAVNDCMKELHHRIDNSRVVVVFHSFSKPFAWIHHSVTSNIMQNFFFSPKLCSNESDRRTKVKVRLIVVLSSMDLVLKNFTGAGTNFFLVSFLFYLHIHYVKVMEDLGNGRLRYRVRAKFSVSYYSVILVILSYHIFPN